MWPPATLLYKSKSHISEFIKAKSKVVAKIGLLDKKKDKRPSIKYQLKVLDRKSECSMKFKDSLKNRNCEIFLPFFNFLKNITFWCQSTQENVYGTNKQCCSH